MAKFAKFCKFCFLENVAWNASKIYLIVIMKSIVEYKDYRQYIQDYYDERKRSSAFTWREFAKLAGFASGSYLKLVCDGKTRLMEEGAKKRRLPWECSALSTTTLS